MSTRLKRPLQRLTATATALGLLVGTAGCASPYHFSSRLDTRLPSDGGEAAPASTPLAGDLHLSLAALMGQRRQLWQAAGETELMKNATAFGLIGLGAAAKQSRQSIRTKVRCPGRNRRKTGQQDQRQDQCQIPWLAPGG